MLYLADLIPLLSYCRKKNILTTPVDDDDMPACLQDSLFRLTILFVYS